MSKAAMKLALEALEQYTDVVTSVNDPNSWVTVVDAGKPAREAITALREALAEPPAYRAVKTFHEGKPVYVAEQPAQQHGWKLVPLEPTQEMIDAVPTKPHPTRPNGWGDRNVAIYKAMIGAAP